MRIKDTIGLLAGMSLLLILAACTSDETTEAKPGLELLKIEKDVVFPASETAWTVNVTADCHWDVSDVYNSKWDMLTISPRTGEGNGMLVLTTDKNRYSVERTATVTLSSKGGLKLTSVIHQSRSDADLSINQDEFIFGDTEGMQNLIVSSNSNWQILGVSGLDWLEFGQTSGNAGLTELPIKVKDAFDDVNRSASITISAGTGSSRNISFNVSQAGKSSISLAVTPYELPKYSANGHSQNVSINCKASNVRHTFIVFTIFS